MANWPHKGSRSQPSPCQLGGSRTKESNLPWLGQVKFYILGSDFVYSIYKITDFRSPCSPECVQSKEPKIYRVFQLKQRLFKAPNAFLKNFRKFLSQVKVKFYLKYLRNLKYFVMAILGHRVALRVRNPMILKHTECPI